jgi:predicted nucleic acid-binding Zn finger protein
MSIREQKGRDIAAKSNIIRNGNLWLVPSQSGKGKYQVDAEAKHCTCPDFEIHGERCKHIFAVLHTIEKTKTTVTENGKVTVTETVKVTRKTYKQEWPAYHKAQTNEKRLFLYLLHQLCQGVGGPAQQGAGRRFIPLEDMIFAMAFKVYSTVSGRRFMTDLKDAHSKGYLSKLPSYNAMFDYFDSEMLTAYLQMLIEESSLPLTSIETDFAVDSTGISASRFVQWMHAKYSDPDLIDKKNWVKIHLICGVKTNVVTAVEITNKHRADCPLLPLLVQSTRQNFVMNESARIKLISQTTISKLWQKHRRCPTFLSNPVAQVAARRASKASCGSRCITTTV